MTWPPMSYVNPALSVWLEARPPTKEFRSYTVQSRWPRSRRTPIDAQPPVHRKARGPEDPGQDVPRVDPLGGHRPALQEPLGASRDGAQQRREEQSSGVGIAHPHVLEVEAADSDAVRPHGRRP